MAQLDMGRSVPSSGSVRWNIPFPPIAVPDCISVSWRQAEAAVDAFHAAGIANGGEDNGKPGIRPDYSQFYYAAFVIDPDGYRLEAYFKTGE